MKYEIPALFRQYEPVIYRLGFIRSNDLKACVQAQKHLWLTAGRALTGQLAISHYEKGGVERALSLMTVLDKVGSRSVLIGTNGDWCCYFDNKVCDTLAEIVVEDVCSRLRCVGGVFEFSPRTEKLEGFIHSPWAVSGFSYYDGSIPNLSSSCRRIVRCFQDYDKWFFEAEGQPQEFEDVENYEKKSIQERLTPDILFEYMERLEIKAFDLSWYKDAFWHERVFSVFPRKSILLEKAQVELGLRK